MFLTTRVARHVRRGALPLAAGPLSHVAGTATLPVVRRHHVRFRCSSSDKSFDGKKVAKKEEATNGVAGSKTKLADALAEEQKEQAQMDDWFAAAAQGIHGRKKLPELIKQRLQVERIVQEAELEMISVRPPKGRNGKTNDEDLWLVLDKLDVVMGKIREDFGAGGYVAIARGNAIKADLLVSFYGGLATSCASPRVRARAEKIREELLKLPKPEKKDGQPAVFIGR